MTQSAGRLPPQDWMRAPGASAVISALDQAGGAPRFVGGCVRNALLGRPVDDVDLATPLTPERVMAAASAAGLHAIGTGLAHGTVTIVADRRPYEVTTLRRDVETDGRRAVVAFTDDWAADAARRDFTMNALYAEPDGTLHDPAGGLADLRARRVRFIGEPAQRIAEDALRVLRFFRMHAHYGAGELDAAGLAACATAARAGALARLSGERIAKEMLKLLGAVDPVAVLRAMAASGVLGAVLPGPADVPRLQRLVAIEADLFTCDAVLRLGALLTSAAQVGETVLAWRLSNADRDRLAGLHTAGFKLVPYLSIREVRRTLYRAGIPLFKDVAMLRWADDRKPSNAPQWRALLALADAFQRPRFPLTGADVMAAGVPQGPLVGQILAEVEDWWIDTDFTDDPFSLVERLKAVVQATAF